MIRAYADRLEEARLLAVKVGLEADFELGRQAAAIPELREPQHALLMLALYRLGRRKSVGGVPQAARY